MQGKSKKSKGKSTKGSSKVWSALLLLPFTFYLLTLVVEACPLCKEALFDPGQIHQKLSLAKGYAVSIVFMLAMPLALLGGVAALIVRAHHKGRD